MERTVVVFGAGLAGLTAGVTALQAGAYVVLCEKSGAIGGSTALSGGLIWTFADLAELHAAVPDGDPVLQELVFDGTPAARRWLGEQGVRFTTAEPSAELAHGGWADVSGESGIRGLGQLVEPAQALAALQERFTALGGVLRTETALDSLVQDDAGRVVGARVATADGATAVLRADAVVLATGGFQGNPELLTRYVAGADHLYLRANPWSTGDAFLAATAVGAAASPGLDTFYGHAMTAPPARFRQIEFGEVTQGYGQGSIAIDLRGRRFADESEGTGEEVLNQRLARRPEGRGFYLFDDDVAGRARTAGKSVTRVVVDRARAHGGHVVVADSWDELADGLATCGVPAAAVRQTLEEYDQLCAGDSGTAGPHTPGRSRFRFPLRRPPFYAVSVKASITATMGGLAVDDAMRVLRRSSSSSPLAQSVTDPADVRLSPVPGLFAAGGDVGNVSRLSYIGGLATALTTGRVAGTESAR
ncbi:FAD-dependent oxidoreductase [Blastococcus sp. SYSU D00669]